MLTLHKVARTCALVGLIASLSTAFADLPRGKANFSSTHGACDATGNTVVRLANYTFTSTGSAGGTVAASIWSWDSDVENSKQSVNSHTCTFDGKTQTCAQYTPYGWLGLPSGQYMNRSGTYTYNTSTGALAIAWASPWSGVTESWTVSTVDSYAARMDFVTSNYGLTHGRGWGSNASWSTYKTMAQISSSYRFNFAGARTRVVYGTGGYTLDNWISESLNLSTYTTPSAPTPVNCMHYWQPTSSACGTGSNPRTGIIYHIGSLNNSRSMYYDHHCASLPTEAQFPCYDGTIHPYAFQQIIDDIGTLRGFVGVEVQNQPTNAYYQYQLKAYFQ